MSSKTMTVTGSLLHVLGGVLTWTSSPDSVISELQVSHSLGSVFWMTADVPVVSSATYARGGDGDDGWPEPLLGRRTGTVRVCVLTGHM